MERLRLDFRQAGYEDVEFAAINSIDALDDRKKLSARCSFPLFQDTSETEGWDMHEGNKDDFYIYDRDGKLAAYLPAKGGPSIKLATEAGYDYVKGRLIEVLER
ncbi:MAG: hypothetical protein B7733_14805 [Myxococcales bacterium FL481]|nr:MAG: hypothetical protein B7733_14805 [Myxococcales bacterium FL481]